MALHGGKCISRRREFHLTRRSSTSIALCVSNSWNVTGITPEESDLGEIWSMASTELASSTFSSGQLSTSPKVMRKPFREAISRNRNVQLLQGILGRSSILVPATELVVLFQHIFEMHYSIA
jgi:hypothetical protein